MFAVFKKRWLLSLLGVIALAVLIWFIGPLIAVAGVEPLELEWVRALVIGALFLVWGLVQLFSWLRARKANAAMAQAMTARDPAQLESEAEINTLRRNLEEALEKLKKVRLGSAKGRQPLYQLPWYIIIGPPGSGKTTALENSGLNFPLNEIRKLKGVGGTRNCDWWFTDEAVLLDTAGRYTTQDSQEQVDKAAWTGFLKLLKKYRRRRPINGALIAVSLADLMALPEEERMAHARAIRQRVQELHEVLGIRFPIYVLFTKTDLVAGFVEYFEDLGREERQQVWGATFSLEVSEGEAGVDHFAPEFTLLEERLNQRLVERLQAERNPQRRDLIYNFPQQFGLLKTTALRFLDAALRPSRYEHPPLLRGVYFTSGTQEGTPIDRLMGSLATTFSLDRQALSAFSGKGRGYFIHRLLKQVVFPEEGLAGVNLAMERRRRWLQRAAFASALLVTSLVAAAWVGSYLQNQTYVESVEEWRSKTDQRIAELTGDKRTPLDALAMLNAARNIPGGFADRGDETPWSMGLGLYQGEKLGAQAERTYQRLLHDAFLPRIILSLESQMDRNMDNPEYLYEALKVYLMLDDPEHFDAEIVNTWFTLNWDRDLPREVSQEERQQLLEHLEALLARRLAPLPLALDQERIAYARGVLLQAPLAKRVYVRLKESPVAARLDEFRLTEAAGRDAPRVFTRKSGAPLNQGIPGLYTYNGYHVAFAAESRRLVGELGDESWVLGVEQQLSGDGLVELYDQLRQLYFDDFIKHYDALLQDLDVVAFSDLRQAVDVLNIISGPNSPVRRLLEAVRKETSLTKVPEGAASTLAKEADRITDTFSRQSSRIASRIFKDALEKRVEEDPGAYVEGRFNSLNSEVSAQGNATLLDDTLSQLNELYIHMNALAAATDRGGAMPEAPKQKAVERINELEITAQRKPIPLNQWLNTITEDSARLIRGGVRTSLNALWTAEVLPFYRQSLSSRYPLQRGGSREATLEDFGRFFGPNGLVDNFFKQYLSPYVDTTTDPWRWRSSEAEALGISESVLVQFQHAAAIKAAFFRDGGPLPSARFELKPLEMDPDASQFLLDLGGQQVSYGHGPTRPSNLQWPAPQGSQVQVQFSPPLVGGRSGITVDGPWAWFRLLDRSRLRRTSQPERFRVTFSVGGRWAAFELRAGSAFNPFRLSELSQFQCPDRL